LQSNQFHENKIHIKFNNEIGWFEPLGKHMTYFGSTILLGKWLQNLNNSSLGFFVLNGVFNVTPLDMWNQCEQKEGLFGYKEP
jgi:hypothetical protein